MADVLIKRGNLNRHITEGERCARLKAEIRVIIIQAKQGTQRLSTKTEARKGAWNRFFLTALRKSQPWHYLACLRSDT
jgi:hypothetical protein